MNSLNKKGITGVEMVISFAIFISFLMFILIYMNPIQAPTSKVLVTNLEAALYDNLTIKLNVLPFAINKTAMEWYVAHASNYRDLCFRIVNPYTPAPNENKTFIALGDGTLVGSKMSVRYPGYLNINYTDHSKFYYIYLGYNRTEPFTVNENGNNGCTPLDIPNVNFSFSSPRSVEYYDHSRIRLLNKSYFETYETAKNSLHYPSNSDFSVIIFNSSHGEVYNMRRNIPRVNVLSKEFPIEIFDNATLQTSKGYIRILTW